MYPPFVARGDLANMVGNARWRFWTLCGEAVSEWSYGYDVVMNVMYIVIRSISIMWCLCELCLVLAVFAVRACCVRFQVSRGFKFHFSTFGIRYYELFIV